MDPTQKCSVCAAPLKLVPAGISKKTGRPYNSFLACPDGHKQPPVGAAMGYGAKPAAPAYSAASFEKSLVDNSRQNSIIRQHSQDMGIAALEFMFKVSPDEVKEEVLSQGLIPTIKAYTDMFDADARSTADTE